MYATNVIVFNNKNNQVKHSPQNATYYILSFCFASLDHNVTLFTFVVCLKCVFYQSLILSMSKKVCCLSHLMVCLDLSQTADCIFPSSKISGKIGRIFVHSTWISRSRYMYFTSLIEYVFYLSSIMFSCFVVVVFCFSFKNLIYNAVFNWLKYISHFLKE